MLLHNPKVFQGDLEELLEEVGLLLKKGMVVTITPGNGQDWLVESFDERDLATNSSVVPTEMCEVPSETTLNNFLLNYGND